MSFYELFDKNGDVGMLVIGDGVDGSFRLAADKVKRPDERLLTVPSVEALLTRDALVLAAQGRRAEIPPIDTGDVQSAA